MKGVFADRKVTIGDVAIIMQTVHELATLINHVQDKKLGLVEIGKDSIVPLIQCTLSLLLQMLVPQPLFGLIDTVLTHSIALLEINVASRVDQIPWLCCI
jgi:hypothetical protein